MPGALPMHRICNAMRLQSRLLMAVMTCRKSLVPAHGMCRPGCWAGRLQYSQNPGHVPVYERRSLAYQLRRVMDPGWA